jgi:hypothetical protein
MKRLLLSILSVAVIAVGGTGLAAPAHAVEEEGESDWRRCFDACMAANDDDYNYCKADCKAFEPKLE